MDASRTDWLQLGSTNVLIIFSVRNCNLPKTSASNRQTISINQLNYTVMMDFIMAPLIVGIICAGIYGVTELFVRRKERLSIIEKIGDKLDAAAFDGKLKLPSYSSSRFSFSFSSLKAGCLLAGIGLGLLVGFFITTSMALLMDTQGEYWNGWFRGEIAGTAYGASVLLFGGIGLIIAFVVELKLSKDKK